MPNGRDFGDGRAEYITASTNPTVEDYFSVRVDQKLSENDLLFVRYSLSDASTNSLNSVETALGNTETRDQSGTLEETRIFSPTLLNTFRFGYSRSKFATWDLPLHPLLTDPALAWVPGRPLSGLSITGLAGATVSPTKYMDSKQLPVVQCRNVPERAALAEIRRQRHEIPTHHPIPHQDVGMGSASIHLASQYAPGTGTRF